jgi:hypothetical protein
VARFFGCVWWRVFFLAGCVGAATVSEFGRNVSGLFTDLNSVAPNTSAVIGLTRMPSTHGFAFEKLILLHSSWPVMIGWFLVSFFFLAI